MKKTILFTTFLLISFEPIYAQLYFEWAAQIGGIVSDQGNSVSTDNNGNVYTTGLFYNTSDFDPGVAVYNLSSFGSSDAYVSKLDSSGNFIWAKQLGGLAGDGGLSIAISNTGNVFSTGNFQGTIDLDPSSGGVANFTSTTGTNVYISKLNSSGNYAWGKHIEANGTYSIAVDNNSNVYVLGYFTGTVDFNPGAGTANLTSAGLDDIFLVKLSNGGAFNWAIAIGGSLSDEGASITTDSAGNVYVIGAFRGTVDFDAGVGVAQEISAGGKDVFIAKYDPLGNFQWVKRIGDISDDYASSIIIDGSENVCTVGVFTGTVDFDPGAGTYNMTSLGGNDMFVCKLDNNGDFVWAKQTDAWTSDTDKSITTDSNDDLYITGNFLGTVDFDPGINTFNLTSAGSKDIFVQKLNAAGDFSWAYNFGGSGDDQGRSISVYNQYNIISTGIFHGTADFDPDTSVYNLTSAGTSDAFIHKMSLCRASGLPVISSNSATVCLGDSVLLQVLSGQLNSGNNWEWYSDSCGGTPVGTGPSLTIFPTDTTSYFVRGEGSCFTPGLCETTTINVNPVPTPDLGVDSSICDTYTIILDAGSGLNYLWSTSATTQTISINGSSLGLGSHTFFVEVTDANGCAGIDSVDITVITCVGIEDHDSNTWVNVYPNPVKDYLFFSFDFSQYSTKAMLFDGIGKEILNVNLDQVQSSIDVSHLPRGIYHLQLIQHEKTSMVKIVIQ